LLKTANPRNIKTFLAAPSWIPSRMLIPTALSVKWNIIHTEQKLPTSRSRKLAVIFTRWLRQLQTPQPLYPRPRHRHRAIICLRYWKTLSCIRRLLPTTTNNVHPILRPRYVSDISCWFFGGRTGAAFRPILTAFLFLSLCQTIQFSRPQAMPWQNVNALRTDVLDGECFCLHNSNAVDTSGGWQMLPKDVGVKRKKEYLCVQVAVYNIIVVATVIISFNHSNLVAQPVSLTFSSCGRPCFASE
jgi:hypothetical protein